MYIMPSGVVTTNRMQPTSSLHSIVAVSMSTLGHKVYWHLSGYIGGGNTVPPNVQTIHRDEEKIK